jgi:hypothetical protein
MYGGEGHVIEELARSPASPLWISCAPSAESVSNVTSSAGNFE